MNKNVLIGALTGFAAGILFELLILINFIGKWPLRSIIVAMAVTGLGWAIAGGFFGYSRGRKKPLK